MSTIYFVEWRHFYLPQSEHLTEYRQRLYSHLADGLRAEYVADELTTDNWAPVDEGTWVTSTLSNRIQLLPRIGEHVFLTKPERLVPNTEKLLIKGLRVVDVIWIDRDDVIVLVVDMSVR